MIRLQNFEPTPENVGKIVELFRQSQLTRLNRLCPQNPLDTRIVP